MKECSMPNKQKKNTDARKGSSSGFSTQKGEKVVKKIVTGVLIWGPAKVQHLIKTVGRVTRNSWAKKKRVCHKNGAN